MGKVTFDYSKAASFIGAEEVKFMEAQTMALKDVLVQKKGREMISWAGLIFR